MLIRNGYEITVYCPSPTAFVTLLDIREEEKGALRTEAFSTTPALETKLYRDLFGNTCRRFLAPPGELTLFSDILVENSGLVDPFVPDYNQFPLFAKVRPYVVTLEPGDAMFVPASWWHVTHAVTPNLATIVRIVNQYNLMAHLWEHRYLAWRAPAMLAASLKNVVSRTQGSR